MKCSEAVEWMNRYLDHELDKIEQLELFQHLDHCDECAETFDIMKKLSLQLESLPDVSPRFSLVDAIMPQLDEIDRTRSLEDKAIPIVEQSVPQMDSVPSPERSTSPLTRLKTRTRYGYRVAGGAAAALILAFCIYEFQPKAIPNAEPPAPVQTQDSKGSANNKDDITNNKAEQDAPTSELQPDGNTPVEVVPGGVQPAAEPDLEQQSKTKSGSDSAIRSSAPDGSKSSTSDPKAQTRETKDPAKKQDSVAGTGEAQVKPSQDLPTGTDGAAPNPEESKIVSNPDQSSSMENKSNSDESVTNNGGGGTDNHAKVYGLTAPKESHHEWSSPDGKFVARIEDDHLNIYNASTSEQSKVYSYPISGKVVTGEWAQDSSVFAYKVEQDGQISSYQFTAAQASNSGGNE